MGRAVAISFCLLTSGTPCSKYEIVFQIWKVRDSVVDYSTFQTNVTNRSRLVSVWSDHLCLSGQSAGCIDFLQVSRDEAAADLAGAPQSSALRQHQDRLPWQTLRGRRRRCADHHLGPAQFGLSQDHRQVGWLEARNLNRKVLLSVNHDIIFSSVPLMPTAPNSVGTYETWLTENFVCSSLFSLNFLNGDFTKAEN